MRSIVVTGVSSGIGRSTAEVLIAGGFRVFGSLRSEDDASVLSGELGPNFVPLLFDVTDEPAVKGAAAEVSATLHGETLAGLVNNAGIAKPGPLMLLPPDDLREQLEVNLTGQLMVTQAFGPLLGTDARRTGPKGRIVMISSIAARNASPFLGAYSTSKFGLEGFSEALRRELMVFGIDVIIVAPGPIATPIWDKAEKIPTEQYAGTPYEEGVHRAQKLMIEGGKKGLPADAVARVVLKALTAAHPKTRYTIGGGKVQDALLATMPKRLVDRVIARVLALNRQP